MAFVLPIAATSQQAIAQRGLEIAASGPSKEQAVVGRYHPVKRETNVPLQMLIGQLERNWELVDTGKSYWIGYTDDMYSIAHYREQAIDPLVKLIKRTSSNHARHGAILTLHLVGIESRVAGRFHEEFKSTKVRNAFYNFLKDNRIRDEVLLLLVRDPWPSDIPHIMRLLASEGDADCRPTVNALFRYGLACPAFGGTLVDGVSRARVNLIIGRQTTDIGDLVVFTEELPDEGVERVNQLISADHDIVIQHRRSGRRVWKFTEPKAAREKFAAFFQDRDVCEVTCDAIREDDFLFRYCDLSGPFNFQVSGTNVVIIDPAAAKVRWLEWWGRQSQEHKNAIRSNEPEGSEDASRSFGLDTNRLSPAASFRR